MVVVGRRVGTFEPARVMVEIAHATRASARANTIAPSQPADTAAGKNGKGMSQLSASPASTASAHAIGGRTMTFAVSAVSAMAGPGKLRYPDVANWSLFASVAQNRRQSETYRLERMAGRGIIAPRRSNSAHLHRPWRAIQIKRLQTIT